MFKKIIISGLLFLFWNCSSVKKNSISNSKKTVFPESWVGTYKGDLKIFAVDSVAMKLPMSLIIKRKNDSIYNFKLIYTIKDKKDVRDYEIKIVNKLKGLYQIDEKNSIVIDAVYRNEIFTSFFKVMQNYIVASYTKKNDDIIFEIISADAKNPKISGNKQIGDENIPEVTSYLVNGRQKAILSKVDN